MGTMRLAVLLGIVAIVSSTGCSGAGLGTFTIYYTAPAGGGAPNAAKVVITATGTPPPPPCPFPAGLTFGASWWNKGTGATVTLPAAAITPACPAVTFTFATTVPPNAAAAGGGGTPIHFTAGPATLATANTYLPATVQVFSADGTLQCTVAVPAPAAWAMSITC